MEGNIVVDGVLASCYPSSDHGMAHLGMAPSRWIPEIVEWILGNDNRLSTYVKIAEYLGKWVIPYGMAG